MIFRQMVGSSIDDEGFEGLVSDFRSLLLHLCAFDLKSSRIGHQTASMVAIMLHIENTGDSLPPEKKGVLGDIEVFVEIQGTIPQD